MTATTIDRLPPSSGTTAAPTDQPATRQDRVTLRRVVHSEWIKLRSLRSTWAMLTATIAALLVFGGITGFNNRRAAAVDPLDDTLSASLEGYFLAQLLIGVLGVLLVAGEYSTGMVRSTFAAVPRRTPVLLAKTAVLGLVSLATMTVATVGTFLGVQVILGERGHSFADPSAVRIVLGTAVFLTLIALLGSALGWLLRNVAASIAVLTGLLLILPGLAQTLLGGLGRAIAPYLPSNAAGAFIDSIPADNALSPAAGLAVLVAWVVVPTAAAAVQLHRRDA